MLVYLPGFDGTWMAPFIQMPELSTTFDVRCLTMAMEDRSLYHELKQAVVDFISEEIRQPVEDDQNGTSPELPPKRSIFRKILRKKPESRSVYIVGESFGGILASDVALTLLEDPELCQKLKGLTLINSATCFDRSKLSSIGPKVAKYDSSFSYNIGLVRELLPLLADEYSWPQMLLILKSKALPSVIDSTQRESFMGRVAFSIFQKLKYMPQETLKWRLEKWLAHGCNVMRTRIELFKQHESFPTLIIAGERDLCLPSIEEAERLSSIFANSRAIVVKNAGHASTCGSRIDLAAEIRNRFLGKGKGIGRTAMKEVAAQGEGVYYGMEPRYDGRDDIGLSPIKYWSRKNFRKPRSRLSRRDS